MSNSSRGPVLVSLSILHRHGARRPSPSEISQWADTAAVRSQWPEKELGSLTELGRRMGEQLGEWFASVVENSIGFDRLQRDGTCWRSSSSKRGRESGQNFVDGFNRYFSKARNNSVSDANLALLSGPAEYPGSQDLYFRPWLPMKADLDSINSKFRFSPLHLEMAEMHKDFLHMMGRATSLKLLSSSAEPSAQLEHLLWETSHVFAALKCEAYWASAESLGIVESGNSQSAHEVSSSASSSSSSSLNPSPLTSPQRHLENIALNSFSGNENSSLISAAEIHVGINKRDALSKQIKSLIPNFYEFESKLEELACYVWTCRHLSHPLARSVGKFTFLHFLTDILNGDKAINVFSGHDYTILVLLSAWGLLGQLKQHLGFCSYVTFELWACENPDSIPEFNPYGYPDFKESSDISKNIEISRFVRIAINWLPFRSESPMKVDITQYEVLGIFSEESIRKTFDEIR